MTMKTEIVILSPEQAGAIVAADSALAAADSSKRNRKWNYDNYQKFCSFIKADLWKCTHQGIAIASDGRIVDGQHRLTAIRDCGQPVQVMITWDADPTTFDSIDTGKPRSGNDIWGIGGFRSGNVAAIAKLVYLYETMPEKADWQNAPKASGVSHAVVWNWADSHGYTSSIAAAGRIEERVRREIKGIGSPLGASVAISEIYGGIPGDQVFTMLYEPLMKCVGLQDGTPVYALHRILGKRDHRDAKANGNPFSTTATGMVVNRARLGILLRVIADTYLDRQRVLYKFSLQAPLIDMSRIHDEVFA